MPIYEYQCDICGKTFELLQSKDEEARECCGQKVKRVPSVVSGFRFPKELSFAKDCCKRKEDEYCKSDCESNRKSF